jgi:hypothetical protein
MFALLLPHDLQMYFIFIEVVKVWEGVTEIGVIGHQAYSILISKDSEFFLLLIKKLWT